MIIVFSLPPRTWAALDAAFTFFREAPVEVAAARRLARTCRYLHGALAGAGLRWRYLPVATTDPGKALFRLHVQWQGLARRPLTLRLPPAVARGLVDACLAVIAVQTDPEIGTLLDHEAEELQAVRAFLSAIRRQVARPLAKAANQDGRKQLRWDQGRREYTFTDRVAERVQLHYLRAGAALN